MSCCDICHDMPLHVLGLAYAMASHGQGMPWHMPWHGMVYVMACHDVCQSMQWHMPWHAMTCAMACMCLGFVFDIWSWHGRSIEAEPKGRSERTSDSRLDSTSAVGQSIKSVGRSVGRPVSPLVCRSFGTLLEGPSVGLSGGEMVVSCLL